MAFCDLFKEFQPIRVDEDIYLRQTEPKKDARPFWEIYYDEENFKYFGLYKRPGDWNEERELRVQESRLKGFKGKREYTWVVTLKGETIGQIQLFNFGNHNTFAERVNNIFGDKDYLKFSEEECEQVNTLLWGYVVSLV